MNQLSTNQTTRSIFVLFICMTVLSACAPLNPYRGKLQYTATSIEQMQTADIVGKHIFICRKESRCIEPGEYFFVKEKDGLKLTSDLDDGGVLLSDLEWLRYDAPNSMQLQQNSIERFLLFAPTSH